MPSTHPPIDPVDVLPRTIRQTSDRINFGGTRVLVRELPSVGEVDVPGGISHFLFCYRPPETVGRMVIEHKGANYIHVADRSLPFVFPSTPHTGEWSGVEELVAHFLFHPAFLEEVAVSLRIDPRRLHRQAIHAVAIDEPLQSLCRLLMDEVETGCTLGSSFFESVSRGLAVTLIRRLAPAQPTLPNDPRIERAVRFIEQHFQNKISLKDAARVAGLSPYHFLRTFRSIVGISPHEYLIQFRLRYAERLIISRSASRSIADIAVESGFCDETHFARHFRRAFGQSPRRWLRQQ
jgi:AraC family transcriptional regulator